MAYVKILYQDSPSTATPLNAQNLNHMDDGIAENDRRLNELATAGVVNTFNGRTGNVTSEKGDYDIAQIAPTNGATEGQIPILTNVGTEEEPVLEFQMQDVPSSGHVIQNASGTDMAQEDAMQFPDSFVSDDDVNGRTVVENIKEVSPADYDSTTDEGIIVTDDGNNALIGAVSDDIEEVTGNGSKTYATLLNELYAKIDKSKLTPYSKIVMISQYGTMQYDVVFYTNSIIVASQSNASASDLNTDTAILSSASTYYQYRNGTSGDASSTVLNNGGRITLYYGNRNATVDLQTTANRCLYDDNTTVKQKIDEKASIGIINITNIYLNDLTWSQDTAGKYYALIQRVTSIGNGILISAIITEFEKLKASDVIQLYWLTGTSDIKIMSNVNSFTTNARISIRLAYVKE